MIAKLVRQFFAVLMLVLLMVPTPALCWRGQGHHWYGPGFNYWAWHSGYWFHGGYLNRVGWWWVVGPTWYFYSEPIYPFPPPDMQPVFFVQASTVPPTALAVTPSEASQSTEHAFSYYCEKALAYFPLVRTCEGNHWIVTPVRPPN